VKQNADAKGLILFSSANRLWLLRKYNKSTCSYTTTWTKENRNWVCLHTTVWV